MYHRDSSAFKKSIITSMHKEDAIQFGVAFDLQKLSRKYKVENLKDDIYDFIEANPYLKAENLDIIKHKVILWWNYKAEHPQQMQVSQSRSQIDDESQAQVQAIDYVDYTN